MTPEWFHQYLSENNCEFQNTTFPNYRHAVYKNIKNGIKFTILKDCVEMKPESVILCCYHLGIPQPGCNKPMTFEEFQEAMNKTID
jgi:hypothetical protein